MTDIATGETFVKICGVTNQEDAFLAIDFGCDAIGFNFVSTSKRRVETEFVKNLVKS